jgi:hypothetical protein
MKRTVALVIVILVATLSRASASGPLGIYGIVEKVVFEPSEASPERIQVWGAFAYTDNLGGKGTTISKAVRGYLYFKLPDASSTASEQASIATVKKEWMDLKSVAGTGQAVGFGRWFYIAGFGSLQPDQPPQPPSVILFNVPRGGSGADLRVRPASEPPASPAIYQTDVGIVKLSEQGSHAAIVKELKGALNR